MPSLISTLTEIAELYDASNSQVKQVLQRYFIKP